MTRRLSALPLLLLLLAHAPAGAQDDEVARAGKFRVEARGYFTRLIHEVVVERIARELKLVGRVWNDDSEARPGKTASSRVVLARTEADLGVLGRSAVEQAIEFGTRNEPLVYLLRKYGPDRDAMEAILAEWGGPESERLKLTPSLVSIREGPQAGLLYQYAIRLRDAGKVGPDATLGKLTESIFGPMFRRLEADARVELRTDDDRPDLPLLRPDPKR